MAQLHEYQGKRLLQNHGIEIPQGETARTAEEAFVIAERIGKPVVVKAQIHNTSRAAAGGIKFADTPQKAFEAAQEIFANTAAEAVLIDEKLEIEREFYLGFIIDDRLKRPTLLLNAAGGSGVEERAATMKTFVCSVRQEPDLERLKTFVFQTVFFNLPTEKLDFFSFETNDLLASKRALDLSIQLAEVLIKLYRTAKSCEARIAEINPLALLKDGRLVALDARISVDDYAVFRHEDLGIDIARELGHQPTKLERIAWEVEKDDFRGTFYFVEVLEDNSIRNPQSAIRIGFHGAGGGGSMASLDAAQRNGLQPACYVDTSGNPPASKVYRAARIILEIPNIKGYFLSGSGVASQEQFGLARAVIKAFLEVQPQIPAVLRLGGNGEEIAAQIVEKYAEYLPAPIEAYQKIHSADFCAARLKELVQSPKSKVQSPFEHDSQFTIHDSRFYSFKIRAGRVFYDHTALAGYDTTAMIESCPTKILSKNERGLPVLNITEEEAERGKCVECLACEFAAWDILGIGKGAKIDFPITGLEEN